MSRKSKVRAKARALRRTKVLVDWLVAKGLMETRTVNGNVQYRAIIPAMSDHEFMELLDSERESLASTFLSHIEEEGKV